MVEVDAGDHRAIGVQDVHGVQPPAQPHFQDGHINVGARQAAQDGQGGEFEVGQRYFCTRIGSCTLHCFKGCYQIRSINGFAMDPAALLEMHQMR